MLRARETVYSALFAKLCEIPDFKTRSRILQDWNSVPPASQPALFLAVDNQVPEKEYRQPYRWHLKATIWVYALGDGSGAGPMGVINGLLDAIEAALAPDSSAPLACTLGGICMDCAIVDEIEVGEDAKNSNQGIAIIPIEIVVT